MKRKQISTSGQLKGPGGNVTTVTKVTRVDQSISVAKKSFTGLIEHKRSISIALREGKALIDIKGIRFVKPF